MKFAAKRTVFLLSIFVICLAAIFLFMKRPLQRLMQPKTGDVLEVLPGHEVDDALLDAVWEDSKVFPMLQLTPGEDTPDWDFGDSWLSERTYGGQRLHEGTDIMTAKNVRGLYPVISMSDGVVEKLGWLEKGGWRIGIRSEHDIYYYYAHLESYMPDLSESDMVYAGDILGFAGDSGYGEEGTVGNFAVHLHFGIYVNDKDGVETAINSYPVLVKLEQEEVLTGTLRYCLSGQYKEE